MALSLSPFHVFCARGEGGRGESDVDKFRGQKTRRRFSHREKKASFQRIKSGHEKKVFIKKLMEMLRLAVFYDPAATI